MVSLSNILNHGLLLISPSIFVDVATPQQASIEQYNIINFLGGSAPYKQRSGYGISTDLPANCSYEQIQMISRHSERMPSTGDGQFFNQVLSNFNSYKESHVFKGDLSFLNNYEYFVTNPEYYEKETNLSNSDSPYTGTTNSQRHGSFFRQKYGSLYNPNEKLPVFTSNSGRCYQSSNYFARGFLGDLYSDDTVEYVIIDEDSKMGANSLTPRYACKNINSGAQSNKSDQFDKSYLDDILNRWLVDNPGLNITTSQISGLFLWCAFEINVRGYSPFCNLFTLDEFIRSGYQNDVGNYYSIGEGNNMSKVVGSPMVEASLKLLQEDNDNKIWLMFTHDTDMELYLTSYKLIVPENDLSVDQISFPNPYNGAEMFPQSGRTYLEKFKNDNNESFVRFIMNDSVFPYPNCQNGPGFSCPLDKFIEIVNQRLEGVDYSSQCDASGPPELTFFWDYNTTSYDAPLINQ
ncbi:unnamed protein product [Candida verbasci]|uniref:Acid phosphatase n=1 Tax=Candida verbasci TaxID=1227364 RepID=A0A9W4TZC3_9ASCO|nr:unnamed protein product [Candida verbasci]